MKTTIVKLSILVVFQIHLTNICFTQEKTEPGEKPVTLYSEIPKEKTFTPQRNISEEELELNKQLLLAKHEGKTDEMQRIQKEIDASGGSVTLDGIPAGSSELMYGSVPPEQAITSTKVLTRDGVNAVAIHKEQIGTSNRTWAVVAFSAFTTVDTIYTMYSDDDGNSWNYFSRAYFGGTRISRDEIDIELVQTTTEKILYTVCGVIVNSTGKGAVGLLINKIGPSPSIITSFIFWPGENMSDGSVRKYRPRITSDCAQYEYSNAWIYIACCQDSLVSGGLRTCVKTARVINPYTASSTVTTMAQPFYFNDLVTEADSHMDLAYYKDGLFESIAILQSNIPPVDKIYLTKSHIENFTSFGVYSGNMDGGTTRLKRYGYISSNGNFPNLMITTLEEYSAEDYDVQYFRTTDGSAWTSGYIDFSSTRSFRADIMERKNVQGEFYCAYSDISTTGYPVHFCKSTGSTWGSVIPQMNHLNSSPYLTRACYKSGTDNCFVIWGQTNYSNIWSSSGCSGSVVTNKNLQLNLFIQGRYRENLDYMIGDTLQIQIRNNFSPYAVVSTANSFQNNNGTGSYNFPTAVNGTNYYLVIKHRNSIETWSRTPGQSFSSDVLNYNFYTWAQAYGGNLVEVDIIPYRFAIYTGDVNQDGVIEAADVALIDNAAYNFLSGYIQTELTGDLIVDGSDYLIADNNAANFISRIRP